MLIPSPTTVYVCPGKPDLTEANRATYLSTSTTSSTSPTQTPSTTPSQTSSPSSGGTNVGAIVGGVVGGIAGLALLGFILFFLLCRHRMPSERIRSVNSSSKKSIKSKFRSKPLSQNSSVDLQLKDATSDGSLMEGGAGPQGVHGTQMAEFGSYQPFVPPSSAFLQPHGDISGAPSAYGGHAHTLSNQSTSSFGNNTYAQSTSYASDTDNATPFIPMMVTHARTESDPNTVTSTDPSNFASAISPTTRQVFTVASMGGPVVSTPPRRRHNPPAYTPVSSPDESMVQGPILGSPTGHRNQPSDELSGIAQLSHTDLGSSSFRVDTPGDVTSNIDTLVGDAGHSALSGSPSASDAPLKPRPAQVLVPQNADPADTETESNYGFPADRKTG